jgi:hypothetical protein
MVTRLSYINTLLNLKVAPSLRSGPVNLKVSKFKNEEDGTDRIFYSL